MCCHACALTLPLNQLRGVVDIWRGGRVSLAANNVTRVLEGMIVSLVGGRVVFTLDRWDQTVNQARQRVVDTVFRSFGHCKESLSRMMHFVRLEVHASCLHLEGRVLAFFKCKQVQ